MQNTIIVLVALVALSLLSCNTTSSYTGLSDLTIYLHTSNSADYIAGEVILQNTSDESHFYNGFARRNSVRFPSVKIGNYSLVMGTQKIVDNISVSKSDTLFVMLDNTEVITFMDAAKQTYLETVIRVKDPCAIGYDPSFAILNDVSFMPLLSVFNGKLVAVFYGGKYHGDYPDVVLSIKIENLTFYWPYGYPILVWYEGYIYELFEAYEQELLSRENLKKLHNSNQQFVKNEKSWNNKHVLNFYMMQRIKHDYVNIGPRPGENINDVVIHNYYGVFNNSVVLALSSTPYILMDVVGDVETIAGKFFGYSNIGYEILVWHEGIFYRLRHAYAAELLTDDNIETIWLQYQEEHHNWD